MPTQSFAASVRRFPTADRDPLLISRTQAEQLIQEIDLQTRLLRAVLIEVAALVEITAASAFLKADDFRKDV